MVAITENNQLSRLERLQNAGKFDLALQLVLDIEKSEKLSPQDLLRYQLFKSDLLIRMAKFKEALKTAKHSNTICKKLDLPLLEIDTIITQVEIFWRLGQLDKSLSLIKSGTKQLESLLVDNPADLELRRAKLLYHKATIYIYKGELDQALRYFHEIRPVFDEVGKKEDIATTLGMIGVIYFFKGALDQALNYYKQSVLVFRETGCKYQLADSFNNIGVIHVVKGELEKGLNYYRQSLLINQNIGSKQSVAATYRNIGEIYHQKDDIDQALEHLEQSLRLFEYIGNDLDTSKTLLHLISTAVSTTVPIKGKKPAEYAKSHLQRLKEMNTLVKTKIISQRCKLAEALVLKTNKRSRYRVRAEEILEDLVSEEIIDHEITLRALLNLCDLLLFELRISGDQEVLNELQGYVERILNMVQSQQSYSLLAESYLLQSKLALLEHDQKRARNYLTLSQNIAEEKGLKWLTIKISGEHDQLLNLLHKWNNSSEYDMDMPLAIRLDSLHLEEQLSRMLQRRIIGFTESLEEIPVAIMLLYGNGKQFFSKNFDPNFFFDEQTLASILTEVTKLSSKVFSGSSERIKVDDYTLLVRTEEPLIFCYVYKGRSYRAIQKLTIFMENLKGNEQIWEKLLGEMGNKQQVMITDEVKPLIEGIITEIF
ncbi:MAG: tetratricopeptide repeat protein [Candidatus Odinarchaeota archaeon]